MSTSSRPQFSDIDDWGATHMGKVRKENQDHFFLGALVRGAHTKRSSVEPDDPEMGFLQRRATLAVIADGVGGHGGGEEAARRAVQGLVSSVSEFFYEADGRESEDPEVFARLLHQAALACHAELLEKAAQEGGRQRFATTLTLFLGLWPHAYLLQVGDSRAYLYRDGALTQISRDQTLAQDLVDQGVMTRTTAEQSQWAHILSSALGGEQAVPVVTRIVRDWGNVLLFCSDGLTKHVSDRQIRDRLASMTSARQVVDQLIQDALDGGGSDNVTIVVGRTLRP
jgi:serine/threonine protein phosphatase PrpC